MNHWTKFSEEFLRTTSIKELVDATLTERKTAAVPREVEQTVYDGLRAVDVEKSLAFKEAINEHDRQAFDFSWIDLSKSREWLQNQTPKHEARYTAGTDAITARISVLEERISALELLVRQQ